MLRRRLMDEQWDLICDLFAQPKRTGRPPRDRRSIMAGSLWIWRTGSPGRDLPNDFGPWATVWDLFDTWNGAGTLCAIRDRWCGQVDLDDELWCVDGTVVRAAKCAAGGGKKGTSTHLVTF